MVPLHSVSAGRVFRSASKELRGLLSLLVVVGENCPLSIVRSLEWRHVVELGHGSERQNLRQWTLIYQGAPSQQCYLFDLPNWCVATLWAWFNAIDNFDDDAVMFPADLLDALQRELCEICAREGVAGSDLARWQKLGEFQRRLVADSREELGLSGLYRATRDEFFLPPLLANC